MCCGQHIGNCKRSGGISISQTLLGGFEMRRLTWHGNYTDINKNASLIISDFLASLYKNEQPRMAYLCEC